MDRYQVANPQYLVSLQPNVQGQERLSVLLLEFVALDNCAIAAELIEQGADVNYRYDYPYYPLPNERRFTTALFEAKSPQMAKLLMERGADPQLKREILREWFGSDWHYDSTGEYETFLTMTHPAEMAEFVKSLKVPGT